MFLVDLSIYLQLYIFAFINQFNGNFAFFKVIFNYFKAVNFRALLMNILSNLTSLAFLFIRKKSDVVKNVLSKNYTYEVSFYPKRQYTTEGIRTCLRVQAAYTREEMKHLKWRRATRTNIDTYTHAHTHIHTLLYTHTHTSIHLNTTVHGVRACA